MIVYEIVSVVWRVASKELWFETQLWPSLSEGAVVEPPVEYLSALSWRR